MTDLTTLRSPSTLCLHSAKGTGLPRRFNRRSPPPFISIPSVIVQMVDTDTPPLSPVRVLDETLLSPPPHTFRSRAPSTRRPSLAPSEPSSQNTTSFRSPDRSSPHPKSREYLPRPNRRGSSLTVVPPPTILCVYLLPMAK